MYEYNLIYNFIHVNINLLDITMNKKYKHIIHDFFDK